MPFTFERLAIPELILIRPKIFSDPRGLFMETYQRSTFEAHGIKTEFVQDNLSRSVQGTLRGLHFQRPPWTQAKLVWASRGEVFDVAVDLRKSSPTFGRAVSHILSAETREIMYIPIGFAHGFFTLSDVAEVQYKSSMEYRPTHESGIRWDDPALQIQWPIADPLLSEKDRQLPLLTQRESPFE